MPSRTVRLLLGASLLLAMLAGFYAYQQHTMKNTASLYNEARQKKLAAITDDEIRDALDLLLNQLDAMQAIQAKPQPPESTAFAQPRFGELDRHQGPEQMVDAFVSHLLANREAANSVSLQIPFALPLPYRLQWQTLQLDTGQQLPIEAADAPLLDGQPQAFATNRNIRLSLPGWALDGPDPLPVRLLGRFHMTLPSAIHVIEFSPKEIGQQKQIGPYVISLTALEGHYVQVRMGRSDGQLLDEDMETIEIEAKDSQGRYLRRDQLNTGEPDAVLQAWIKQFDLWLELAVKAQLSKEALGERIAADIQELDHNARQAVFTWQGDAAFMGQVEQLRITLLVSGERTLEQAMSVPVRHLNHPLKGHTPAPLGLATTLPDVQITEALQHWPFELTPEQLGPQVRLKPEFSQGEMELSFHYPDTLSNWFLPLSSRFQQPAGGLAALTFHDASGKAIQNLPADAVKLTYHSIHYIPARFPVEPVRLSGQWQASIMTDFKRRLFTADDLPAGVSIDQDVLLIHEDADLVSNLRRHLLARDADGQYLKPAGVQRFEPSPGQRMSAHYFHGRIASVELFERGTVSRTTFPFEVPLPKPE